MKNSLVVIIIIVAAILGFLVGYSLAPRTDVASSGVQETTPASGGYGAAPASGGHGAPAGGYGK